MVKSNRSSKIHYAAELYSDSKVIGVVRQKIKNSACFTFKTDPNVILKGLLGHT